MKTFEKCITALVVLNLFVVLLTGCGRGGSSADSGPGASTSLSGVASKGLISGATVTVYALDTAGNQGSALATTTTGSNGAFSVNLGTYTGSILVVASGGSYTDEATGATVSGADVPVLRAALTGVSGSVKAAVTPMTEIAAQKAGTLTAANIIDANNIVSSMIGGVDIITTMPADVLVSSTSTTAEKDYGLMLATISQMASDSTSSTVSDILAEIATDLSDNKLETTGAAISTSLDNFIVANPILSVTADTLAQNIDAATSGAIRTVSSLTGTFKVVDQSAGFFLVPGPQTGSMVNGYVDTLTFGGDGNCTWMSGSATEYDMIGTMIGKFMSNPETNSCTYTVAADGQVTIPIGAGMNVTLWLNADGTTFIWGGGGWSNGNTNGGATPVANSLAAPVFTEQAIGVKQGTGMTNSSLTGTFKVIQQSAGFFLEAGPQTGSMVNGYEATWSFDGSGNCSVTDNGGTEYDMNPATGTIEVHPGSTGTTSCTYSVAANGTTTITISGFNVTAWLNSSGTTFIWGGGGWDNNSIAGGATSTVGGGPVWTEQAIAVKQGAAMTNASLTGTFKAIQQSAGFFLESGPQTGSMVNGYVATWSFDGSGNCSVTDNGGTEYDMNPATGTIEVHPGSTGTTSCTYSVAANGTATINIGGFNITAWLNADGTTFIWGGGGWDNNSIAGGATPTVGGGPVWTEQAIGVKLQ